MGVILDEIAPGPVALDTVVFIYYMEENPRYLPAIEPLFDAISRQEIQAVTSELTLMELLVGPYRRHDDALAGRYEAFLTRSRGLRMRGLDRPVIRSAALIRARTRMKTPDALQLAAAREEGCGSLVTNDRDLQPLGGVKIVQVGQYV